MKKIVLLSAVTVLALSALPAYAATAKTYQVTGPIVELPADKIVVQKGSEKWEIALGTTALPAGIKVGDKVTVEYSMTAATITSKEAAKAPKADKPAKAEKVPKAAPAAATPAPAAAHAK